MRRAARTDENHSAIVAALRKAGVTVQDLSAVGKGVPDLLCSRAGLNILIEVKRPKAKGQRGGELTDEQIAWIDRWPADVHVVTTAAEALKAVGL